MHSTKHKIIFVISAFVFLGLVVGSLNYAQGNNEFSENVQKKNIDKAKHSVSVCTAFVEQEECYFDYPKPVFNWKCETGEEEGKNYFYSIQVDDGKYFFSPEFDSGEFMTSDHFFKINKEGLVFGHTYNWRVRVKNDAGEWSDWAEDDESFVTSIECK